MPIRQSPGAALAFASVPNGGNGPVQPPVGAPAGSQQVNPPPTAAINTALGKAKDYEWRGIRTSRGSATNGEDDWMRDGETVAVLFRKPAKDHPNGLEFEVLLDKLSEEGDWLKVRATYQKRFQTVTKQQNRAAKNAAAQATVAQLGIAAAQTNSIQTVRQLKATHQQKATYHMQKALEEQKAAQDLDQHEDGMVSALQGTIANAQQSAETAASPDDSEDDAEPAPKKPESGKPMRGLKRPPSAAEPATKQDGAAAKKPKASPKAAPNAAARVSSETGSDGDESEEDSAGVDGSRPTGLCIHCGQVFKPHQCPHGSSLVAAAPAAAKPLQKKKTQSARPEKQKAAPQLSRLRRLSLPFAAKPPPAPSGAAPIAPAAAPVAASAGKRTAAKQTGAAKKPKASPMASKPPASGSSAAAPVASSAKALGKAKASPPSGGGRAQAVQARLPGAADPPWLQGYSRKEQYGLRHFGWPVMRKRDGAVGIVKAVNGDSVTLEWGQTTESLADAARAGPRAAHPIVTNTTTEEDEFEKKVRKGALVLQKPQQDASNQSAPTCGPPCPECDADLGVGAEAWTRCWSCDAPEPGAHAGINARKHKHQYQWAPSTLLGPQASDESSDDSSDSE